VEARGKLGLGLGKRGTRFYLFVIVLRIQRDCRNPLQTSGAMPSASLSPLRWLDPEHTLVTNTKQSPD
jgi:hypothetical protein